MVASIPLPRKLDVVTLSAAVLEYESLLDEQRHTVVISNEHDARLLVWIDALVLDGYDLPPRLERQLFSYFEGRERPVQHDFSGWLPADLKRYVPLYEWLTRDHASNHGAWLLDVFKPAPAEENDAFARFLD